MAKYKTNNFLNESHARGEDYIALTDCLGRNWNTTYTIDRLGRYKNLRKGGSYNRKIDKEVILGAIDILEGNPLMTLQLVNFALRAHLSQKPHFTQQDSEEAPKVQRITTFG